MLDDPRDIGDQGDAAVSHDRRAREDIHALHGHVHRLDDDFFGPANFVHEQTEPLAPLAHDHDVFRDHGFPVRGRVFFQNLGFGLRRERPRVIEHFPQTDDGQQTVAQAVHLGVEGLLDAAFHPGMQTDGFFQLALGDRIPLAVHADDQAGNDRQRQRHAHDHRCPDSGLRVDRERTFEELDVRLDHVHADSAAGHLGDLSGGRKTGQQDQGEQFSRRHPVELGFRLEPHGQRLGPHGLGIDAPPIIANLDANLAIFV